MAPGSPPTSLPHQPLPQPNQPVVRSPPEPGTGVHRFRLPPASTRRWSPHRRPDSLGNYPPDADSRKAGRDPGTTSGRACDRCRTFKKRCSRTFPSCSLCVHAGEVCSLSIPPNSDDETVSELKARVEALTQLVNQSQSLASIDVRHLETDPNSGLSSTGQAEQIGTRSGPSLPVLLQVSNRPSAPNPAHDALSIDGTQRPGTGVDQVPSLARTGLALLSDATDIHRCISAYFRHIHRAYPFMDKAKFLDNLEGLTDLGILTPQDTGTTLLFLIVVLGRTTLQRSGQASPTPTSTADVAYTDIIQQCLGSGDLVSVQVLILLAVYSWFDPLYPMASSWFISDLAARQVITLGLGRTSTEDKSLSTTDVEHRHRVFWSAWILDRVSAISRSVPPTLADENIDVPLPGLTVEEFASPDRPAIVSTLQTHRHIIRLRQLEDTILRRVHTATHAEVAQLTRTDRQAIIKDIRREIENWYSHGCLLAPLEPDTVPIHTSVAWLSARYYHLLFLLNYPTHFNSYGAALGAGPNELVRLAQRHLQSTAVLLQQRQLPLNRITLCRMLPLGFVLLHWFLHCMSQRAPFSATAELETVVKVLGTFPKTWDHARRGARLFRHIAKLVDEMSRQQAYGQVATDPYIQVTTRVLLTPIINDITALMRETMGGTTAYIFEDFFDSAPNNSADSLQSAYSPVRQSMTVVTPNGAETEFGSMSEGQADASDQGWDSFLELGFV